MWERIREILIKEIRQTFREPRMRVMLFVPPIVQLIVFGFAVNLDVDHVRLAWLDGDRTPASRELLAAFQGSGRFEVVALPASDAEATDLLDRGEAQAIVQVLAGFAGDINRGRSAEVQVLIDGTNSNTASLISSYAGGILGRFSSSKAGQQRNLRLLMRGSPAPAAFSMPSVEARTRVWFNP